MPMDNVCLDLTLTNVWDLLLFFLEQGIKTFLFSLMIIVNLVDKFANHVTFPLNKITA